MVLTLTLQYTHLVHRTFSSLHIVKYSCNFFLVPESTAWETPLAGHCGHVHPFTWPYSSSSNLSQPLLAVLRCVLFPHKWLVPNSVRLRGREGLWEHVWVCLCVCVCLYSFVFQAAASGCDPSVNHSTARTTTSSIASTAVTTSSFLSMFPSLSSSAPPYSSLQYLLYFPQYIWSLPTLSAFSSGIRSPLSLSFSPHDLKPSPLLEPKPSPWASWCFWALYQWGCSVLVTLVSSLVLTSFESVRSFADVWLVSHVTEWLL